TGPRRRESAGTVETRVPVSSSPLPHTHTGLHADRHPVSHPPTRRTNHVPARLKTRHTPGDRNPQTTPRPPARLISDCHCPTCENPSHPRRPPAPPDAPLPMPRSIQSAPDPPHILPHAP